MISDWMISVEIGFGIVRRSRGQEFEFSIRKEEQSIDRIEPGPERDERADPSAHLDSPGIRLDEPVEHLEKRRLPGPVVADEAEALAATEFEGHVVHRPEFSGTERR